MSLNHTVIYGNLVRDSELVMTTSGTKVLHNSVAVSETYKGEKKTDFFDFTAFAEKADIIEKFFKKGQPILIEGKLHQDKWEKDGKKNSKVVIWVDNIVFTENKKSNTPQKQELTSVMVEDGPKEETEDTPF